MSFIGGIFDLSGGKDHTLELDSLATELLHDSGMHCDRVEIENFAATLALLPSEKRDGRLFLRDGDHLLIDGKIFDPRPIHELVDHLFNLDLDKIRTINGQYNAILYRRDKNQMVVVTDKLATRPLYHTKSGDRHAVCSKARALGTALSKSYAFNPNGLLELFLFGHNLGVKTLYDGITVFPPGSVTTIDHRGVKSEVYYRFHYCQPDHGCDYREWAERIIECVMGLGKRYSVEPTRNGVLLSGGLDSRLVAAILERSGIKANAFTFGAPNSREVRYAAKIAKALGFPHSALEHPKNYLSKCIMDVVRGTECSTPFFHTTSVLFHDQISAAADRVFVGFGGGLSGGLHTKPPLLTHSNEKVVSGILNRAISSTPAQIASVFQPDFLDESWQSTLDGFRETVDEIDEEFAENIIDVWNMRQRQPRFTYTAPKVDRHRFEVLAPLLDDSYVNLTTSMPISARRTQLAYRNAIVRGFPNVVDVPWTRTGRRISSGQLDYWGNEALRKGLKIGGELKNRVRPSSKQPTDSAVAADPFRSDDYLLSGLLREWIDKQVFPSKIFNKEGMTTLINSHMRGADATHAVGMLLTLGAYLTI